MRRFFVVWLACLPILAVAAGAQTIPAFVPPPAAAQWENATLPAAEETASDLHVTSPGRFTLAAHSATGAAIQLVDMLAGPGDLAGEAGGHDGRLSALLDSGTYRLRVFQATGATGPVSLTATPFRDAAPPRAAPPAGTLFSATLDDNQQRGFWFAIPPCDGGHCLVPRHLVATGRALADLRLWRNGRDLVPVVPDAATVEPVPGHPLAELTLQPRLEPGIYLLTAYGGPATIWADSDTSRPFYLRFGLSPALDGGTITATVGPSGREMFAVPAWAATLRLDIPRPAAITLAAITLAGGGQSASLEKKSRETWLSLPVPAAASRIAELRGQAGQAYTLRAIPRIGRPTFRTPGTYWVSAQTIGMGGDEIPPSMLLLRDEVGDRGSARILSATVPHVGPDLAWRYRFNLRGPTRLLVQADKAGPLALQASGVTLDHPIDPRDYADVAPDILDIPLIPARGSAGAIDLTIGPPDAATPLTIPWPADPAISFGIQSLAPFQTFRLAASAAPGAQAGLAIRKIPVALADGPLILTQIPGQALSIPVSLPPGTSLAATVAGVAGPLPVGNRPAPQDARMVELPAPSAARTIILSAERPPATEPPIPEPAPESPAEKLDSGAAHGFDLAADRSRQFTLHVAQGGLFQVQTTGRLRTRGHIGTAFIPDLAEADANGAGRNMLLQTWLSQGDYRVSVTARDSAGHLGIEALPAPLAIAAPLQPGASLRTTLEAGAGVAIPIQVPSAGKYRLALLGRNNDFTARLDDSQGWPLIAPGPFTDATFDLRAGTYRLLVTPGPVTRRLVASLAAIPKPVPITGHGPHALPLGDTVQATWREPPPGASDRPPDLYTFTLAGPAQATATLGEGMQGVLIGPSTAPIRFADRWHGPLAAGDWRVELRAQGRNDRLEYSFGLQTAEVQPGRPSDAALPGTRTFTLAADRVVTLTTTGRIPVKAVLRGADGRVLARLSARPDDWNLAFSQRLKAGAYSVDLQPALPPATIALSPETMPQPIADDPSDTSGADAPSPDAPSQDAPGAETPDQDQAATTTLLLNLPPDLPVQPATPTLTSLAGEGVHLLAIAPPPPGALLAATAQGPGTTMLALERQDATGAWQVVVQSPLAGAPLVGALADASPLPWRAAIWSLDGGQTPIAAGIRTITEAPLDRMAPLDGLPIAVGRALLPQPTAARLAAPPGTVQASWPGHAASAPQAGIILPQTRHIWALGPLPGALHISAVPPGDLTLDLAPGETATLPAAPASPGHWRIWRAESGQGQPALRDITHQGAAAPQSSVLQTDAAPILTNAGQTGSLRARLHAADLTALPDLPIADWSTNGALTATLKPGQAVRVTLPAGTADLTLTLTPGLAALPTGQSGVWAPVSALTRTIPPAREILLANLGHADAAASIAPTPHVGATALQPGMAERRFFGAAGSFVLQADLPRDCLLTASGDARLFVRDAAAKILAGLSLRPEAGPAEIVVEHGPGPVVIALQSPGHPAWPSPEPVAATIPATLPLAGPAMALRLPADGPMLLHASTTAPVLLSLDGAPPELFPAGAEFHRSVQGPAILHILSPHDGPLSGTLALSAEKLGRAVEGLGPKIAIAPGGTAAFAFDLAHAARIGLGVRAEPDTAQIRLLDSSGRVLGQGMALLRDLPPGSYVIEARVPPDAPPTTLRPALIGTLARPGGPPPDVVATYLELVGLKPTGTP